MKTYRVTSPFNVDPGTVLKLVPAQSAPRKHVLKEIEKGTFQTTGPVQFKVGEVVGIEGALSKRAAGLLEEVAKDKAVQSVARQPAAA